MKTKKTLGKKALALAGAAAAMFAFGGTVPSAAQPSSLAMLASLNKGEWTLNFRDGTQTRRVCLRDGVEFIQLQHSGQECSRFVIEDNATEVTVQYTCRGNGYGRTTVRRETGALVQIESQGIVNGRPFELSAEARHTGSC